MSEMVDRVARAILDESKNFGPLAHRMGDEFEKRLARAAIEAMKPTSNAMDVAGVIYLRENHSDASGCFEEMIQAALKEQA